jgi:DNA-nicking Smr family endonuclease
VADPAPFSFPVDGEPLCGLARGVDRRHLDALRRGEIDEDAELDLHGLAARDARVALRVALDEAWSGGLRCVRVVHGRGRHSEQGPVLKASLAAWLAEPPLAARVLAFAPAASRAGGAGATLVLLRRRRNLRYASGP